MNPVSDIDMIYSRWHNNLAVIGGAISALVTTVALARISESITSRFINWDTNRIVRSTVIAASFSLGFITGHLITTQAIGLIAQSNLGKLGISLTFSALGTLSGIALYHQTRAWL